MIRIQYLCGMRPQDVTIIRRCDLDTSGQIWLYRPGTHKTAYRGNVLVKAIPQAAQPLLAGFFKPDLDAYLFSPREAWEWTREHRPTSVKPDRKTPIYRSLRWSCA
jgi:integrase